MNKMGKTLTADEILAKYPSARVIEEFDNSEWVKGVERGEKMLEEEHKKQMKDLENFKVEGERIGGFSAEEVRRVEKYGISKETEKELRAIGVDI